MATQPDALAENIGRITAATPAYPYGSAQDDSTGTTGDGTPFKSALLNDIYGFQQAMLSAASIVPSGTADSVTASQYLEALDVLYPRKTEDAEISGVWEVQDNRRFNFGDDADIELFFDSTQDNFTIELSATADFTVRDNGIDRLRYHNGDGWRINDDQPLSFGTGGVTDSSIQYSQGANALDIRLGPTADLLLRENGTTVVQYDNGISALVIKGGADLQLIDDHNLIFGTGNDTHMVYAAATDTLDVNLDATADFRVRANAVTAMQFDQSADFWKILSPAGGGGVVIDGSGGVSTGIIRQAGIGQLALNSVISINDGVGVLVNEIGIGSVLRPVIKTKRHTVNGASAILAHETTDRLTTTAAGAGMTGIWSGAAQIRNTNNPVSDDDLVRKGGLGLVRTDLYLNGSPSGATATFAITDRSDFDTIEIEWETAAGPFGTLQIHEGSIVNGRTYLSPGSFGSGGGTDFSDFKFNSDIEMTWTLTNDDTIGITRVSGISLFV